MSVPPVALSQPTGFLWLAVATCRMCGDTVEEWGTDEEDACMELEGLALCMGWAVGAGKEFACARCVEEGRA